MKLFVYGILKDDRPDDHYVLGKFWDVGSFPAIVLNGTQKISGQVIEVDKRKLAYFDRVEGTPYIYRRVTTEAYGPNGPIEVFIYEWNMSTNGLTPIDVWNK